VVRVMVMVRVSIRVYVMILFCRSIALFSVFYAFPVCVYDINVAVVHNASGPH